MHAHTNTIDRIAMWLGGSLVILGTVVLGLLNAFIGESALFSVDVRATVVALGFVVFGLYAVYRVVTTHGTTAR